ncbi:hypothetical protein [Cedecea sp. P7760]|uniref:hypothetical protein n=1 Tax=Cedecea sp. P7760 TaxID=2726983 RepID=UPI001C42E9D9|nr:hypothetical protein [Cedecea sp. P7760]
MQKVMFKRAGITACVFLLGWSGAVGYLSWRYDFNFSPWQKDEASILPLTLGIFKKQCVSENNALLSRSVMPGTFSAAFLGCLSDRSEVLMHRLSLAVSGYTYLSCMQQAENERRPGDECKNAMETRMRAQPPLKQHAAQ